MLISFDVGGLLHLEAELLIAKFWMDKKASLELNIERGCSSIKVVLV